MKSIKDEDDLTLLTIYHKSQSIKDGNIICFVIISTLIYCIGKYLCLWLAIVILAIIVILIFCSNSDKVTEQIKSELVRRGKL